MPDYRPYPDYQPTHIDWLGNIPAHWQEAKIKYGFQITLGKMLQPNPKSKKDLLKPYLRAANIQSQEVNVSDIREMWFSPVEIEALRLIQGDLLISEGGDVGRCSIWKDELEECYFQNAINRARPFPENDSRFLMYWLLTLKHDGFIDVLCNKSTIPHYTAEKVQATPFLIPSYVEQQQIAAFLDRETAKIDQLIAKQQQLIELLKEKRQAVISHAVTKGLNPDVKMKDSGVEWLGDVPEHWEIKRIGLLFSESSSKASSDEELDLPILSVSIHHGISDKELTEEESDRKLQRSDDKSLYKVVHENYLAYNMMRAWQGGFGATKISGLVSPAYVICEPKTSLDSYFFELILRTANAITELRRYSKGITDFRLRLYWDEFKNVCVPVPPDLEIQEILKSIEKINIRYIQLMAKAEQQIGLLRERRAALISAAVTGKIDVREAA